MDLIKDYLAHSYLYYCCAEPVIDDFAFDRLCNDINKTFDSIDSPYKQLILDKDAKVVRGLELQGKDYPEEIKQYARKLVIHRLEEIEAVNGR